MRLWGTCSGGGPRGPWGLQLRNPPPQGLYRRELCSQRRGALNGEHEPFLRVMLFMLLVLLCWLFFFFTLCKNVHASK